MGFRVLRFNNIFKTHLVAYQNLYKNKIESKNIWRTNYKSKLQIRTQGKVAAEQV